MTKGRSRLEWTNEEDLKLSEMWEQGAPYSEIAGYLERTALAIQVRVRTLSLPKRLAEYAVYRGETSIAIGTLKECIEQSGLSSHTIMFLVSPSGRARQKKYGATKNRVTVDRL